MFSSLQRNQSKTIIHYTLCFPKYGHFWLHGHSCSKHITQPHSINPLFLSINNTPCCDPASIYSLYHLHLDIDGLISHTLHTCTAHRSSSSADEDTGGFRHVAGDHLWAAPAIDRSCSYSLPVLYPQPGLSCLPLVSDPLLLSATALMTGDDLVGGFISLEELPESRPERDKWKTRVD